MKQKLHPLKLYFPVGKYCIFALLPHLFFVFFQSIRMTYHLRPILFHLLFQWTCAVLSANAQNQALPGCQSTCGNFSIPYPFGIGKGCYIDKGFEILCQTKDVRTINSSLPRGFSITNTTVPVLGISTQSEIIELSLEQLRVRGLSTFKCYGKSGEGRGGGFSNLLDLSVSPFTFSHIRNKLIAVGCDIFAYISDPNSEKYTSGCASLCNNKTVNAGVLNGSCFGIGCCQTTIPMGLKTFKLTVDSINTQNRSWDSEFNCSFAVLHDGDPYDLINKRKVLDATDHTLHTSTAVLDWAIGYDSCQNLALSASKCAHKGECVKSTTGYGYRCRCIKGYEGNPYLPDGCQGIGVGVCLLLLLAIGFWLYTKLTKRKHFKLKQKFFKKNGGLLLEQQISSGEGNVDKTKIFAKEELEKATDNFNHRRILGTGGSGTVYKGMLTDGRIVAIKKSKIVDESQIGQFINELVILSQINHRHIVKLLGCCLETEVPLLVYEYISNGTLYHHLHGDALKSSISWQHRLRISMEIAGALSYLHSSASTPIFHRDIKSSNILLDENYRATVSDFGISRSVPYEKTHLTTLVQGTFGYLDPEYFHSGQFTEKSDVYSFGVVLVELLTGQKPISLTRSEEEKNLSMHFISAIKRDCLHQILETLVLNEGGKEEIFVVAKIAKRCLKLVGKKRPSMKEVMVELEGLRRYQEEPLIRQNYQKTKNLEDGRSSLSMTGPQSR